MTNNIPNLNSTNPAEKEQIWNEMLNQALNSPTTFNEAYRHFHNYSVQNCFLAMIQCMFREIPLGAINTYNGWKELGRNVKKGEKAISLLMPWKVKEKTAKKEEETKKTVFVFRPNWFVLSQTDGSQVEDSANEIVWDKFFALAELGIEEIPFSLPEGNTLGYAQKNTFAVSPLCDSYKAVLFHELAHIVLGHTKNGSMLTDEPTLDRNLQEVEAELVAHLLMLTLNAYQPDSKVISDSRGYIQSWLCNKTLPMKSIKAIFSATNKILKAGQPQIAH